MWRAARTASRLRSSRSKAARATAAAALGAFLVAATALAVTGIATLVRGPDGGGATAPQVRDPDARRATAPRARVVPSAEAAPAPTPSRVRWRDSNALGLPWAGRLVDGVHLPAEGRTFFTWDPVLRRSPNRSWRRWGSDRLVRTLLRVLAEFRAAHPSAPRIGIGDLSRPQGGDFGPRYGLPGHASHQNGLDADLYYPRRDRRERPPAHPRQIDRALAQRLVDRFVRAGASRVFVGPRTGLTGPPGIVQVLAHHDNHLHVRLPPK